VYKILRIGDPHVQINNLEDSRKLKNFIIKIALEKQVDWIEFLGDLFHTHAIKRIEVDAYWTDFFNELGNNNIVTKVLVGNHDIVGNKEAEGVHALIPYKHYPYINIIDTTKSHGPFLYCPYTSSEEEFFQKIGPTNPTTEDTKVLICHQTFQGCSYENGFYAKDGFDLGKVPQSIVISGHIHKTQQMGKCFYPGTPKWDTASDANEEKGIWYFEHNEKDGSILKQEFISTKEIVTPIYRFTIKEGQDEV
jgi:DNA repair exonuclease SbcCD nuclease subunit